MSNFSVNLKKILTDKRIRNAELSKATGVPMSTLSEWINGRKPCLSKDLVNLARYLDVSLEFLITGSEEKEKLVNNIINNSLNQYTQIHQGLYRVTIEKQKKESTNVDHKGA